MSPIQIKTGHIYRGLDKSYRKVLAITKPNNDAGKMVLYQCTVRKVPRQRQCSLAKFASWASKEWKESN